ncbi:MAG: endolytic transglycosylase MltG [Sulfurospirillum sp.]|nr:endolytic transglycosylase MltG [Sulfurospirillum sp.]
MNKKNFQVLFIICSIMFMIIYSLMFHLSRPINTTKVTYIPKGSIGQIISYLEKKNFSLSPTIDKYMLYFIGSPQSGWIDIGQTRLSRGDFLYKLANSKAAMDSITLIPGETIDIFLYQISQEYNLSYDKLMKYYLKFSPLRDGLIVPETYHIPVGIKERHLILYLINYASENHKKVAMKIFGEFDKKSWYKYLVIASIIQKEAANEKEMPLVSSVIYNRLKKGMKLQMDGTLNYGKFSHIKVTPKRIREDQSKYNTYKNRGLPPHPVSSISKEAILAAIFPKKTDYLYFVKSKKGEHAFSKTYKAHLKNIDKLRNK